MSTSSANDRFKRAEQAANKGNFEYAIELYLQGLTLDPKAPQRRRLHEVEALAIEESGGNPEGSMAVKMKAVGILGKVKKLKLQKKWDEVIPEIEKALRVQPRNASLLLELADALEQAKMVDGAIEVSEEVVHYDSRNQDALRRLGRLWTIRDDPEKAIEYWEKLRMVAPQDKEAAKAVRDLSAANMVRRAEERKAASGDDSFKAMLKSEEESAELEAASKVIRTDEDRRAAIERKKADLRKEPANSRLWRELGQLYQDLREWKMALAAYKKAQEVNPHDMFARDKIGALKEEHFRTQIEELAKAASNGASKEAQERLAEAEAKFLEFRSTEYARRVKEHPTDYDLKLRYGQILMELGNFDGAVEQFQKAVKDPKYRLPSQNFMGQCFFAKGVYALAIGQYMDALKGVSEPDSELGKDIRYNLALAYEANDDLENALRVFQEIMAIDIGYRDVSNRVDALMKRS